MKQTGWERQWGEEWYIINFLQLFLRLLGNVCSWYNPYATLAVSQCCCSGCNSGKQWKLETT